MKIIVLILCLLPFTVFAEGGGFYRVTKDQIRFIYQPTEDAAVKCTHEIENPMAGDWVVKCPYYSKIKEFSVHLLIRRMTRNRKPATWMEVLYWVTNRVDPRTRKFQGTTLNLYTEEESTLSGFTIGQHVDNGYADLKMTFDPFADE